MKMKTLCLCKSYVDQQLKADVSKFFFKIKNGLSWDNPPDKINLDEFDKIQD